MPSRRFGSGVSATLETRQPTAGGKVIVLAQRRQR
jgi:hypothetical protein